MTHLLKKLVSASDVKNNFGGGSVNGSLHGARVAPMFKPKY